MNDRYFAYLGRRFTSEAAITNSRSHHYLAAIGSGGIHLVQTSVALSSDSVLDEAQAGRSQNGFVRYGNFLAHRLFTTVNFGEPP